MFLVEFIGPPGAGKSTIHKKLVQRLQVADKNRYLTLEEALMHVSKSNMDRIYRYIIKSLPYNFAVKFSNKLANRSCMQFEAQNRFLAKWGKSLEPFLTSSAFDRMPINEKEIVISSFMTIGSLYECINGQLPEKTVVFFEEGFLQKSFMFISPLDNEYTNTDKSNLFNYLDNIPLPDITISVNTDFATCYERMVARPEGLTKRLTKIEKKGIQKFLELSDFHIQNIECWLKKNKNKNVSLLKVNNDQRLDSVIFHLTQEIKTLLERHNNLNNKN